MPHVLSIEPIAIPRQSALNRLPEPLLFLRDTRLTSLTQLRGHLIIGARPRLEHSLVEEIIRKKHDPRILDLPCLPETRTSATGRSLFFTWCGHTQPARLYILRRSISFRLSTSNASRNITVVRSAEGVSLTILPLYALTRSKSSSVGIKVQ